MPDKLPYYDIDKALDEGIKSVQVGEPVELLVFAKQYLFGGFRYREGIIQISHEFGRDLRRTAAGFTIQAYLQFRRAPMSVINANRLVTRLIRSEPVEEEPLPVDGPPEDPLQPPLYVMDLLVNARDVAQIGIVRFSKDPDEYKPEAYYLPSRRMTRLAWSGGDPAENMWP